MAPVAERVRREGGLPVAMAWGAGAPEVADAAVRGGQADLVKVGRALLADPHWPYAAAVALGGGASVIHTLPTRLPGTYTFLLRVTDSAGTVDFSDPVTVTVS